MLCNKVTLIIVHARRFSYGLAWCKYKYISFEVNALILLVLLAVHAIKHISKLSKLNNKQNKMNEVHSMGKNKQNNFH